MSALVISRKGMDSVALGINQISRKRISHFDDFEPNIRFTRKPLSVLLDVVPQARFSSSSIWACSSLSNEDWEDDRGSDEVSKRN